MGAGDDHAGEGTVSTLLITMGGGKSLGTSAEGTCEPDTVGPSVHTTSGSV